MSTPSLAPLMLFLMVMAMFIGMTDRPITTIHRVMTLTIVPPLTTYVTWQTLQYTLVGDADVFSGVGLIHLLIALFFGLLFCVRAVQAPHLLPRLMGVGWGAFNALLVGLWIVLALENWRNDPDMNRLEMYHLVIVITILAMAVAGWMVLVWRNWNDEDVFLANSRRAMNQCIACGYSRKGLTADAPCPECGKLPSEPDGKQGSMNRGDIKQS